MQTTLSAAIESYLRMHLRSRGTRNEYQSTLRKWEQWGRGGHIEDLQRKDIRDFLDWVHQRALEDQGTNPGRTANKAREHLRAVFSWAWEQELIESPPRFPKPRPQRDVAGRHYLSKTELNALYFATYQLPRPRGWGLTDADWAILAGGPRAVLQLWLGHRNGLEVDPLARTDSLAECLLGSARAGPRNQGAVPLGLAVLP